MAVAYKNAKLAGSGTISTYATLYSTGAATTAVLSSITITNTGTADRIFRIGIMGSAGTPAVASGEALAWDFPLSPKDIITVDALALGNTQFIRCSSDSAEVNFMAFIAEIS